MKWGGSRWHIYTKQVRPVNYYSLSVTFTSGGLTASPRLWGKLSSATAAPALNANGGRGAGVACGGELIVRAS